MTCTLALRPEPTDEPAPRAARLRRPAPDSEVEIDLDRVVWDPEYRDEVRALLRPGR